MKHLIFICLLFINAISLYSQVKKKDSDLTRQRAFLKEYALCKCLDYGFRDDSLLKKDFSASVLVEQLDYNPRTFIIIDSMVKKFSDSIPTSRYQDSKGKRGVMINCIDYYNSKEFFITVTNLDKYLIKRE